MDRSFDANQNSDNAVEATDEETIVDRIYQAIIEQRLPPGTKLSEAMLCEAFGVGRMRVRRSLLLLANNDVVELQNNRGAYVALPSMAQALEVFEARQTIEPSVTRLAVQRATAADLADLADHLAREATARAQGNRQLSIRLSGEFHVRLAEIARNQTMARLVKALVARTSLVIGLYGAAGTSNCLSDEHSQLLACLQQSDADGAATLMTGHLQHIQQQIDLTSEQRRQADLIHILSGRDNSGERAT